MNKMTEIVEAERKVMQKAIKQLLEAGYKLSVHDGEETTLRRSADADAIWNALKTTDDDYLLVHRPDEKQHFAWVRFVYGNDGWDVVSDYTVNLETIMGPVLEYASELEAKRR